MLRRRLSGISIVPVYKESAVNTKSFKAICVARVAVLLLAGGMIISNAHTAEANSSNLSQENASQRISDTCRDLLSGDKDKISLDFQEVDIQNIFRIISDVSELNVVLSPDVSGTLNVRMIDVGWNTALNLILENHDLGRECQQGIIRIAPKATLAAAQELEPLSTEMIRISYADINEMVANLEGIKSGERATITADVRTNTLILSDIPAKVREMISIIKTLDVRTPQVTIEARIVEVARNYAKELGVKWSGSTRRFNGKNNSFPAVIRTGGSPPLGSALFETVRFKGPLDPATGVLDLENASIVDLGVPSGSPTGAIGVLLATGNFNHILDLELQALEEQGKSRTLASPRVTTLDNKEAVINSGERVPFFSSSAEGTKTEFVDAGIRLTVTPHITAKEDIYLKIVAQQDAFDFGNQVGGVPTITTKEASTEVLVNDGATTVLGGLYQKGTTDAQGSVPYLSKIPYLGYLFRNSAETDDVVELLIFVTPTIVREN